MAPPRKVAPKVPLFCTSTKPFPPSWTEKFCKDALDPPFEVPEESELVPIEGDFVGWTPLQIARRHVVPNFTREESPFTSLTFAIADDKSHEDGKVLMPAIHWDFFDKPGSPLRIEGTAREGPEEVLITAYLLHIDERGINNYWDDDDDAYDNDTDSVYVAEKRAWIEAGGTIEAPPKPLIEGHPVYKNYLYADGRQVSVHQHSVDDPTKDWWLKDPKSDQVREISDEEVMRRSDAAIAARDAKIAEDVRRWIEGTYEYPTEDPTKRPVVKGYRYLLSDGHIILGGSPQEPGQVIESFPERVEVVREISARESYEMWLAAEANRVTQASTNDRIEGKGTTNTIA
ncbi:hypothetical protein PSEUBRA_001225 [Kalmanozyma brasiliensis GHG001]|uniref:uncharacterized protein n=1 Tax=Kalmanozyma brasiliensis (strain GHG001) TaxID=1365824 RepID=UPI002867D2A7|nr:uncharacterized protein PSEUBRA_001225 [Kalmanozyma brasiliensis GHG001]KAF6766905.1 hypothetical protein PSEUBRA_001225 [Kalmanozyma brasiliensis GHG001]